MILKNFIVFEGIDGAGTSTQIKKLVESNPEKFMATAEPTSGPTGKFLRQMLAGDFQADAKTTAYLFAADRCQHIYGKDGIIENIKKGKCIVSDRYFFSSMAYQSISCGQELPKLLNSPFPLPEYLFYFQINPEISLGRVNARNEKKEIYEKLDLQQRISNMYEEIISQYEKDAANTGIKIIRIDASKAIDEIAALIKSHLEKI